MAPERRRNRRAAANAKLPRGEVVWPKRFTVARLDVGLMNELFEDEVLNKGLLRPCEMPKMLFCDGCGARQHGSTREKAPNETSLSGER